MTRVGTKQPRKKRPRRQHHSSGERRRKCCGMTMIEVIISVATLSLLMSGMFILTSVSNTTLVDAFNADTQSHKSMLVHEALMPILKCADSVEKAASGSRYTIKTGKDLHEVTLEAGVLKVDGETLISAEVLELSMSGKRIDVKLESVEIPIVDIIVYSEVRL